MRTIHWLAAGALVIAACYSDANQMGTLPPGPPNDPNVMYGPPGGGADPYDGQYQQPGVGQQSPPNPYQQDPNIYQQPADGFQQPADGDLAQLPDQTDPPQDPEADVTDGEIDATLDSNGSWSDDPDYGRVWRPDPTQVGMDFTPYESGGGWVDSDDGWAFDSGYAWGWLPFHYGRWGWIGGAWGWCPDHHWRNAWVDWRHGGGVVGWRPQSPVMRNHQVGRPMDSQWRFANQRDFGSHNIRGHLLGPAEGLRVTSTVGTLPFRGATRVHAATMMQNRINARQGVAIGRPAGAINNQRAIQPSRAQQPTWQNNRQQAYRQPAYRQPAQPAQPAYRQPAQPTYRQPAQPAYRGQGQAVHQQPYRPSGGRAVYTGGGGTSHFSSPSHSSSGGGMSHPSSSPSSSSSHSSSPSSSSSHSSSSSSSGHSGHR
jgi:hypothetical protein